MLPYYRILNIQLVKPKKGTTMETIGRVGTVSGLEPLLQESLASVECALGGFWLPISALKRTPLITKV